MKIKYITILIVLLNLSLVRGQITTATPDKSFLPNFTPPSPESFAITEYGKNAVSEFSGKVNLSIPIYNYKIGNLNLPVTINYSGAGVKVNDASTLVGTNWILNTGGVINRKINDLADESVFSIRAFIDFNQMITSTESNCQPYSPYFIDLAKNQLKDSEIDEWSFNFNGYSGSFYLDENYNPVYIENENEIKIEIIGNGLNNLEKLRNSHTFLITTPDGTKYYFGGLECERTNVFSGHRGTSQPENSSFYLFKIEDNLNNQIILEYYTDQDAIIKYGVSYQLQPAPSITEYSIPTFITTVMQNQIFAPKFLKKIKNNRNTEEVVFNINTYNNLHYLASLQNIEVYSNTTLIKKVEFSYDFPNNLDNNTYIPYASATRFFLNKIEINKSLLNINGKYEVYKFEYDTINLMPVRFSPKQDILGFFNNKQNQTTIPKPEFFHNVTSPSFGDLNPDFEFAKRGSLTKVIYPTGGFSKFEYEPTKAIVKKYKLYQRNITGAEIAQIPGYSESIDDIEYFTPVYSNQNVKIEIFTGYSESTDPTENPLYYYQACHNLKVQLAITDVTANSAPVIFQRNLGMSAGITQHDFDFIGGHVYAIVFKLLIDNIQNYPNINFINGNVKINLFDGYNIKEGFGVRIKNQKDYGSDNSFSNYKRYYYKNINELNNDYYGLSEINFTPKYTFTFDGNPDNKMGFNINIFSESNIYSNKNYFETYEVVTISEGGDNFENGGKEKYFLKEHNESNTKLITTYDGCYLDHEWGDEIGSHPSYQFINCTGLPHDINTGPTLIRDHAYTSEVTKLDYFNGKLLFERNFIKKNNNIFKNKEVKYDYTFQRKHLNNAINYVTWDFNFPDSVIPLQWCPSAPNTLIYSLGALFKAYYFIETFEAKLNGIVTKEYIDPVPLSQNVPYLIGFEQEGNPDYPLHDLNFKKTTTTQTYTYGSLKGLPIETTVTTSDDNRILKTKNYYPTVASTLNGITPNQVIASNTLVSQNRIATPIQVEQYQNNDLLSTQRTLYKSWNGNPQTVLPEIIQTSKGNGVLEDRAVFTEYDTKGNPTIVSMKDGTKTKYFYNSLNQVILKVENYSASQNIPAVPTWNDACTFINSYPTAMLTIYNYDTITNQITSIVAPNCDTAYYEYDALHQLKAIRDKNGNIVQEFDHNYKPQN